MGMSSTDLWAFIGAYIGCVIGTIISWKFFNQ